MENVEKGVRLSHISHSYATTKGADTLSIFLKKHFFIDELMQLVYPSFRDAGLRPDRARLLTGCHRIEWPDVIGLVDRITCESLTGCYAIAGRVRPEYAPLAHRILFFYWKDNKFILLHHFVKTTNKTPPKEIKQAERNMADHKERNE